MAYFVLTRIQSTAGSWAKAAAAFNIDKSILDKIGKLSSTKGDASTARKATEGDFQDLTPAEKRWLEGTIPKVIHRLGERASGSPLTRISLADLPSLN